VEINEIAGKKVITAEGKFTDREKPREAFWNLYDNLKKNQAEVIHYYGIVGNGKTALLDELERQICRRGEYGKANLLRYSFEKNVPMRDCLLEWSVRMTKNNSSMQFPLFTYAYIEYSKKIGIDITDIEKRFEKNFAENEVVQETFGVVSDFIPGMNTLSAILRHGINVAKNAAAEHKRKNGEDKEWYQRIDNSTGEQLLKFLPTLFARDAYRCTINLFRPFVIMLDDYEQLVQKRTGGFAEQRNDLWLRGEEGIVSKIPNVVWVIAGSEKLDWPSSILPAKQQHLLGNLAEADVRQFFKEIGIHDESLLADLFKLTDGTPSYMDYCAKRYDQIRGDKVEDYIPDIAEFGENTEELAQAYFSDLSVAQQEILTLIACMPKMWNDEMVVRAAERTGVAFHANQFKLLCQLSLVNKVDNEYFYKLHETFRKVILHSIDADERKRLEAEIFKGVVEEISNLTFKDLMLYKNLEDGIHYLEEEFKNLIITNEDIKLIVDGVVEYARTCEWEKCKQMLIRIINVFDKQTEYLWGISYAKVYLAYILCNLSDVLAARTNLEEVPDVSRVKIIDGEVNEVAYKWHFAMACVCFLEEKYEEASAHAQKSYQGCSMGLQTPSRESIRILNVCVSCLRKTAKEQSKVFYLCKQAYMYACELLGEKAPETMNATVLLSVICEDMGEMQEAYRWAKVAYMHRRDVFGEEHPRTEEARNRLQMIGAKKERQEVPPHTQYGYMGGPHTMYSAQVRHVGNGFDQIDTGPHASYMKTSIPAFEEKKKFQQWQLVEKDNPSNRYEINKLELTIGRREEADIQIKSLFIGRKHATITLLEDGIVIKDMGSANGTYWNNERIDSIKVKNDEEGVLKLANKEFFVRKKEN